MAAIGGKSFGGIAPSTHPRNLDDNAAQVNHNLKTTAPDFRPMKQDVVVAESAVENPKTIYRFYRDSSGGYNDDLTEGWITKSGVVDFVKGPLDDDTSERTYYTQDSGAPRVVDANGVDRRLGVPAPTTAPTVTVTPADVYTEERRANDIEWNLLGGMEGKVRAFVTSKVTWTGATNIYALTQRTAANGFNPENPPEVVFGIEGNGSTINDPDVYGWALDPKLEGFWTGTYYCIPVHAYGYFADFSEVDSEDFEASMSEFYNPRTSEQLFTPAQIADLKAALDEYFDSNDSFMSVQRGLLNTAVTSFNNTMLNTAKTARADAVDEFYKSTKVSTAINNALDAAAQSLYNLAYGIYSTPVQEFGA